MASVRLNIFQNIPLLHNVSVYAPMAGVGSLIIQGIYIPGSISLNTMAVVMSASGTTAKTLSISFGLYSLNGATLSLANSASQSSNPVANQRSWVTLVTSATQDITPGNWYFAFMSSTAGSNNMSVFANVGNGGLGASKPYGGPFVRGHLSASTNAMPASIATSDLLNELGEADFPDYTYPYILISA